MSDDAAARAPPFMVYTIMCRPAFPTVFGPEKLTNVVLSACRSPVSLSSSPLLYNNKRRNFSCVLQFLWIQNICQTWKNKGHLSLIFQRLRQLNQVISELVLKAKVFWIFLKNCIFHDSMLLYSVSFVFLAA